MRTNLKVILAATAIAAVASPVLAQPESHLHARAASVSNAHGSATRTHTERSAPEDQNLTNDCVHVAFPQCSGGL